MSNHSNNGQAMIRRRHVPSRRRRDGLLRFAHNVTSQNGEDGILRHLFERIPPPKTTMTTMTTTTPMEDLQSRTDQQAQEQHKQLKQQQRRRRRRRWCVDVGAWDGVHLSNTHSLLVGTQEQQQEPPSKQAPSLKDMPQQKMSPESGEDQPYVYKDGSDTKPSATTTTTTTPQKSCQECWKGILIEADLNKFQQLQTVHHPLGNTCLHVTISGQEDSPQSLAFILQQQQQIQQQEQQIQQQEQQIQQQEQQQQHALSSLSSSKEEEDDDDDQRDDLSTTMPYNFDFLCIDIDGMDYWVLYNVLVHSPFRPQVVCVEFNPTMPSDLIYIPPPPPVGKQQHRRSNDASRKDDVEEENAFNHHHGASLAALVELCTNHDYVLVETTVFNAFFVPQSIYQDYLSDLVPDPSIEALHETTMGTTLYQLYDGTLKVWGCQKLLWHRIPIQESKIQMLCPQQRVFPFAPSPPPKSVGNNSSTASKDLNTLYQEFETTHMVIDMHPWCNDDPKLDPTLDENKERARVIAATALLKELQRNNGFAYIRVPLHPTLCQEALRWTREFLQEVPEGVRRSCLSRKDRARRGYSPMCTENFASLVNVKGKNDLVRKFRMGSPPPLTTVIASAGEDDGGLLQEEKVNDAIYNNSLLQPNIWPRTDQWEEATTFQQVMEEYYYQASMAAHGIVAAICHALVQCHPELEPCLKPLMMMQQPQERFSSANDDDNQTNRELEDETSDEQMSKKMQLPREDDNRSFNHGRGTSRDSSILTLLGYRQGARHKQPQQQSSKKQKKKHQSQPRDPLVAPHTDVGIITFLLFDQGQDCARLQRLERRRYRQRPTPPPAAPTRSDLETNENDPNNKHHLDDDNEEEEEQDSDWIDVPLPPIVEGKDPVFVVNIADCLSELSHGWLESALHRVVPVLVPRNQNKKTTATSPAGRQQQQGEQNTRNGCALFVGLDPNQKLVFPGKRRSNRNDDDDEYHHQRDQSSLSMAHEEGQQEGQRILTFEEWRKERIARAQQPPSVVENNKQRLEKR